MRRLSVFALLCLALSFGGVASTPDSVEARGHASERVRLVRVRLKPGVYVNVALTTWRDGRRHDGPVVFAVPGYGHTAASYGPLAERVLRQTRASAFVAMDLPGHGESGLPYGRAQFLYADLSMDDYATAMLGALDALHGRERSDVLVGHSMGGGVIQIAQQRLLDQGTDLRGRHHVSSVLALAPSIPAELPWGLSDVGASIALSEPFLVETPELGAHYDYPKEVWVPLFFSTPGGVVPPTAPTPEEAEALGYIATEPQRALFHLAGHPAAGYARPSIDEGLFSPAHRTELVLVAYSADVLFPITEQAALDTYLRGASGGADFIVVEDPYATHETHVHDPQLLDEALGRAIDGCL
jgi:pimeloyl-ACP methyl ester carboxylesterase